MYNNIGCGVIIINKDNKILLGQRVKPIDNKEWGFPGGKIEDTDILWMNGAKREVFEETGILIKDESLPLIHYVENKETNSLDLTYQVRIDDANPIDNPKEMINYTWFTPKEALGLNLFPSSKISLIELIAKNQC